MNISRAINQYYVLTFFTLALLIGCADNEEKIYKKNINQNDQINSSEISLSAPETKKVFFDNGILKEESTYLNGKLEGASKEYYQNGKLRSERLYHNGKVITETKIKYYATGALLTETNYKNGKLHGVCRTYFENGRLHDETHFEAGEQIGASLNFYINGQILSKCEQLDGTDEEICRTYYPNGNVRYESKASIKGRPTFPRKEFYETGTLKREIFREDQIKTVKNYYENGQLMEVINYKEHKKHGNAKFFEENGDLTLEQMWEDGKLIEEMLYETDSNNQGL